MKKEIAIIGAGLVGSLLSLYLVKRGHRVTIYERRDDMRTRAVEAGRSINLALSDRGIKALEEVGIAADILPIAIPMHGRQIHPRSGTTAFQPYGRSGQFINSVSRRDLNIRLMDLAETRGVVIRFSEKCETIDWETNTIHLGSGPVQGDLIFGADGAYSAARLAHMLQHQRFEYSQEYIDCGYKELSIPAGPDGGFLLAENALHIWPRGDYMLIALPNSDGSFTGTLFFPFEGERSFEKLRTEEDVRHFFEAEFPDVMALVPDLVEQYFHNPTSSLVTVRCFPWIRGDRFALIGDAAHAIVPFFGQGMNAGFEDCRILDGLIDECGDDWTAILAAFQERRKPDAEAIAELAIGNFTEMRSKTADPRFLLQKKIEARLHERHPDKWIPAYTQVTFSPGIRYSEALMNSRRQEEIMQEVMKRPGIDQEWDSLHVEEMVLGMVGEGAVRSE
ncbi:MAG: FAD-dependent monooxygenase [Flaviaesturariibacter sp.]|nr:FAD-dependent monooxygenase [Flaviaesturariibacter sp.]